MGQRQFCMTGTEFRSQQWKDNIHVRVPTTFPAACVLYFALVAADNERALEKFHFYAGFPVFCVSKWTCNRIAVHLPESIQNRLSRKSPRACNGLNRDRSTTSPPYYI